MNIQQIYSDYQIPINLQMHMIRTAAIGHLIFQHWRGPSIDYDTIITTLLLHDMGNIVKINLDQPEPFFVEHGDMRERIRNMQNHLISLYGNDDHNVTNEIVKNLGLNDRISYLIREKLFIKNDFITYQDDYELKITAYADQRVGPLNILSLHDRFNEAKKRSSITRKSSMNHPDVNIFIAKAYILEEQVLSQTDLKPSDINDRAIAHLVKLLSSYRLTTNSISSGYL
jgi:hypothetical protein